MRPRPGLAVLLVAPWIFGGCGASAEHPPTAGSTADPARPASAQPGIEPRRGIAGARLGMTRDAVEARLGPPVDIQASELHGGWTKATYRTPRMRVTFNGVDRVWDVRTYDRASRAPGGVGVGSTERRLRKALRLRCRPYGGPARYRAWRVCTDTAAHDGPFTDFTLVHGRVRYVTVAAGLAM